MTRPIKILLVDDEPANLPALSSMLETLDCELTLAHSGPAALRQVSGLSFAAILIDLQPAIEGIETARLIRDTEPWAKTPIIFLAPPGLEGFPFDAAYALGGVDFLVQPVNPLALRSKIVFFLDLFEKNAQLDLLRQAQTASQRLQDIFQQAPAFLCTLQGPDHVFDMANERYYQLIDKSPAIIGNTVRQVLPEVAAQGFIELLDSVYHTGKSYVGTGIRLQVRQDDGSYKDRILDFVYVALRAADGSINGVLAHGIDISERKEYEERARATDERYRRLIAAMDEGFCLIEVIFDGNRNPVDYRFLEVNPVFSQQTGLGADAVGKTVSELVPDLDPVWIRRYGQVALTGEAIRFVEEARAMHRWFDVYATRLGGPDSTTVALLFSDITARRKADEDLRRLAAELSEASRRKSEFLAVLAHELRNPLAPIRTGLDLMRIGASNPVTVNRVRDMIDRQLNHMVHLIDDLMDVARITSGKVELKKQTVVLKDVLSTAVETSMPAMLAAGHILTTSMGDDELLLYADPIRISQVVGNLLTNAAKYTPNGGRIAVAAERRGDRVAISVADNGVGIPADSLPSVFDMFSQVSHNLGRSQGGLGIGLSIVRQLVELHGGQATVSSEGAGKGSRFEVVLPLAHAVAHRHSQAAEQVAPPSSGDRVFDIIVADDNVDAAASLAALLEVRGHRVRVAHDGKAALAMAAKAAPQVMFLDLGMPELTGHEVAQAVRNAAGMEEVRLIALTGWGSEEDRNRTLQAGFDHHLIKPARLATVDELLRSL